MTQVTWAWPFWDCTQVTWEVIYRVVELLERFQQFRMSQLWALRIRSRKKGFPQRENSEFDPSEPPKYLWTYKIRPRHGGQSSVDSSSTWVCNHPAVSKNTSHRGPSVWEEHAGVALCVTWPTSRDSVLWRSIWRKTGFPSRISFETSINLYDYTIRQIWNQQQGLCLSMSDFHPESWNPSWRIESILVGLVSFMLDHNEPRTTGGMHTSEAKRREFALASFAFNAGRTEFQQLFPEFCDESKRSSDGSFTLSDLVADASNRSPGKVCQDEVSCRMKDCPWRYDPTAPKRWQRGRFSSWSKKIQAYKILRFFWAEACRQIEWWEDHSEMI